MNDRRTYVHGIYGEVKLWTCLLQSVTSHVIAVSLLHCHGTTWPSFRVRHGM